MVPGAAQQPGSALDDCRAGVRGDGRVWGTVGDASGWREAGRLGRLSEPVPGMGGSGPPTVRLLPVPLGQRRRGPRVPGPHVGRRRPLVWRPDTAVPLGVRGISHKHACFQSKLRGLRTSDQTGRLMGRHDAQPSFSPTDADCRETQTRLCLSRSLGLCRDAPTLPPASRCLEAPQPQTPLLGPRSSAFRWGWPPAHLGRRCSGVGLGGEGGHVSECRSRSPALWVSRWACPVSGTPRGVLRGRGARGTHSSRDLPPVGLAGGGSRRCSSLPFPVGGEVP